MADFGLLRELPKDDSFYHMQTNVPCPVRWMPPESITDRNFSTASDVWSFGILIWEMFNPTKTPYTSLGNIEVATKVCICTVCDGHLGMILDFVSTSEVARSLDLACMHVYTCSVIGGYYTVSYM